MCGERSGDRGLRGAVDQQFDARKPVQANELDEMHDLRLSALQKQPPFTATQAIREHRQVDHQRRIGKYEVTQIDEHIALCAEREHERASAQTLCAPILVPGAKQHRRVVGELDDLRKLQNRPAVTQA
jgi:hypothetical protein